MGTLRRQTVDVVQARVEAGCDFGLYVRFGRLQEASHHRPVRPDLGYNRDRVLLGALYDPKDTQSCPWTDMPEVEVQALMDKTPY